MDQITDEGQIDNERDSLKKEFGELYNKIMEILYRNDPVGISIGTNTDEYEHEVIEILHRLKEINSPDNLADIIYQFFVNEFGPIITGKRSKFINISQEIWYAYKEFKDKQDNNDIEEFRKGLELQEKKVYEKINPILELYNNDKISKKEAIDKLATAFYELENNEK